MSENLSALRGNPSFVWRAGQDRRLNMILQWGKAGKDILLPRILVDGCGVGMYVKALEPYAEEVHGIDIEIEYLTQAVKNAPSAFLPQAAGEHLPYPDFSFDLVLSHEVLEHVRDDRMAMSEIVRVLKAGGRGVIFVPNRLYPFETHGHYWRGEYHFGNTPLINYLPDTFRNRLAFHVRAYTVSGLQSLLKGLPAQIIYHTQIFPGYDNIVKRKPRLGKWLKRITYAMENSPLANIGLSHFLVVEKTGKV